MALTNSPGPPKRTRGIATQYAKFGPVIAIKHPYVPFYMSHGGHPGPPPGGPMIAIAVEMNTSQTVHSPGTLALPFDTVIEGDATLWNSGSPDTFAIPASGIYLMGIYVEGTAINPVGYEVDMRDTSGDFPVDYNFTSSGSAPDEQFTGTGAGLKLYNSFEAPGTVFMELTNNGGGDITITYARAWIVQLQTP